jgi:hypothetical protein
MSTETRIERLDKSAACCGRCSGSRQGASDHPSGCHAPVKIGSEQLPASIENGCIVVADDVTEAQLAALRADG